jgi:hypothetical protein
MKTILELTRLKKSAKSTIGVLKIMGTSTQYFTLELPWKNNQRKISCIPEGTYKLEHRFSPKYGQHFWVKDVPGRDMILIHAGNKPADLLGCIAVGITNPLPDFIGNSRAALADLKEKLKGQTDITLIIK